MAAKRLLEDPDDISDRLEDKRVRRLPSFTVVINKAVAADFIQNLCPALEPLVRTVVREEVERGHHLPPRSLQRSPQMLMEEPKTSFAQQLIFKKPPSLPIFTENRIKDDDGFPLQILLTEIATGAKPTTTLPSSIKLEIVVLNGDFPYDDSENWSSSEFNCYVVKEREGRKPLLTGTTAVKLKDGAAAIDEIKFTDNSSWTRSGNFRIGVRVSSEHQQSLNIREAVSNPFKVKDRHGEVYRKHYPPSPNDEVWRLVNIAKDGVIHKRLVEKHINTVHDFLKLSVTDSAQLRKTLGMPERKWEATINHARTCPLGDKLNIHNDSHFCNVLNPICDVQNILVDGSLKTHHELSMPMRVREEVERGLHRRLPLLQRSTQMLIEEPKPHSPLQLIFKKQPFLAIFTENRIEGDDGFPLQIILIETATGARPTTALSSSIKLEIVVLDGDFPFNDSENWSSSEFNRYVVKEREGRKPLLTGTTAVTLKDGAAIIDELKFSDNSSWTRSGSFRIGVRVSSEKRQSLNIREAVSSPIMVKDRRGESYMKHYPPLMSDEVWRLENIGKDGVFHKRLAEMNINTVQDFLKLSVGDSAQLRKILRMSDRNWEATINHARTCPLGDKLYIHNDTHLYNVSNPICDVQNILVDGALKTHQELSMLMKHSYL